MYLPNPPLHADHPDCAVAAALLQRLRAAIPALSSAAETSDASGAVSPATWAILREIGVLTAPLPLDEGGVGLVRADNAVLLFDVLRALGGADLVLARLVEGHVNAVSLVETYGRPAQREALARAVRDGAVSAVWGADGARPLTAVREGHGFRLKGDKVLASGAGTVTWPLVTAATPDGPQLLLLTLARGERADVSRWTAQGMRASATGTVDCDGLFVGEDAVIGAPGDLLRQPHFSGGAWRFCAAHLGAMERLTDLFRQHLVDRKRDGDPFQGQRVAACVAAATTARFWIRHAGQSLGAAETANASDIVAFANLTRMVTERAALDVLEAVHRGVGLVAFVRPHPIERISRDLATYLRQPVPDLAMADAAHAVLASACPTGALWERP